jgi:secondary thiamine-phosphate synthase enzyme
MKSYRKELLFNTSQRKAFINITRQVADCLEESGFFINDDERGLHHDFDEWLEQMAPYARSRWQHNETGEDNADAHLKRQVMGREVVVAVTNGRLDFGPWEQIFYGEFDGRRRKRVLVKIIGE